jgi:hypothetical protein
MAVRPTDANLVSLSSHKSNVNARRNAELESYRTKIRMAMPYASHHAYREDAAARCK